MKYQCYIAATVIFVNTLVLNEWYYSSNSVGCISNIPYVRLNESLKVFEMTHILTTVKPIGGTEARNHISLDNQPTMS